MPLLLCFMIDPEDKRSSYLEHLKSPIKSVFFIAMFLVFIVIL